MPRPRKDVAIDIKTIKSMMRDFGIYQYTQYILKQLLRFNQRCVSVIFKEAKLSAKLSKRKRTNVNDLQMAILKAKNGTLRITSPCNVPEKKNIEDNKIKDITIEPDVEIINDELYNIIHNLFDRQSDDTLPDLGYFDIEEFIRSIQVNQDTNENKFDVDSLLNDPYSL